MEDDLKKMKKWKTTFKKIKNGRRPKKKKKKIDLQQKIARRPQQINWKITSKKLPKNKMKKRNMTSNFILF
jgi:hypothetical protein